MEVHPEPVLQCRVRRVLVGLPVAAGPAAAGRVAVVLAEDFLEEAHREVAAALVERAADKPGRCST